MDFLNKGKELLSGNQTGTAQPAQGEGQAQGQGQQQDYLDKGVNMVQSKLGMDKDGKYDKYEEQATDFARGQYEKSTGKKVSDKISN